MQWHQRAKARALALNLSYPEIARRLHLSTPTVSNYLNGHREPRFETLIALSNVLGMSVAELFAEGAETVSEPAEVELLRAYRRLSAADKTAALTMVRALAGAPNLEKH